MHIPSLKAVMKKRCKYNFIYYGGWIKYPKIPLKLTKWESPSINKKINLQFGFTNSILISILKQIDQLQAYGHSKSGGKWVYTE